MTRSTLLTLARRGALIALAAPVVALTAPAVLAGAEHPLELNNDPDYEPSANDSAQTRPSSGDTVYVTASQYKSKYQPDLLCLVRTDDRYEMGRCADAMKFTYEARGGSFRLKDGPDCLSVASSETDGDRLVPGTCDDVLLSLEHTIKDAEPGAAYERNLLHVTATGADTYVSVEDERLVLAADPTAAGGTKRIGISLAFARGQFDKPFQIPSPIIAIGDDRVAKALDNLRRTIQALPAQPLAQKPDVVLFFVDTFRADAVNKVLTPQLDARVGTPPFTRSFSGASATIQSTYTLMNMRPAFEREYAERSERTELDNGGVAVALLKKLGYQVVVFSRPDWYETFVWNPKLPVKAALKVKRGKKVTMDCYPTPYHVELPLTAGFKFEAENEIKAEALEANARAGKLTPDQVVCRDEVSRISPVRHDNLVVDDFVRYTQQNKSGGHVYIVYLSSLHYPQIPVDGIVTNGAIAAPTRLPYEGLWNEKSSTATTIAMTSIGAAFKARAFDEFLELGRERLARTYYNQVRLVDAMIGRALDAFDATTKDPYYLVVMGDHGEGLGENGISNHGHRPAQKIIEAPIFFGRSEVDTAGRKYHAIPLSTQSGQATVTQMDIFPALLRALTGDAKIFATWGLDKLLFTDDRRAGCHVSSEPHGSADPYRIAIYDSQTDIKMLLFGAKNVLHSTSFVATHLTDYRDRQLPPSASPSDKPNDRCVTLLLSTLYAP